MQRNVYPQMTWEHTAFHLARTRIRDLRCKFELTQAALARKAGCTCSTIHELECGIRTDLHLKTFLRLCRALHVTPNFLLGIEPARAHALGFAMTECAGCPLLIEDPQNRP